MRCPFCSAKEVQKYFPEDDAYRTCCEQSHKIVMKAIEVKNNAIDQVKVEESHWQEY